MAPWHYGTMEQPINHYALISQFYQINIFVGSLELDLAHALFIS